MSPPQASGASTYRVLMTTDTMGGVWTYAADLCRGLERYGVEVMLVSMGRMPDEAQQRALTQCHNVVLVPTEFRLEGMTGRASDLDRSGALLMKLEQGFKPDVVHINGYSHASLPFHAPVVSVAHSCVASWWSSCRRTPLPGEWSDYCRRVREGVQAAQMLVAPTAAFLEEFRRLHGAPRCSQIIWNGRDYEIFRTGPKHNLVLAAGRPSDEAKNIGLLCRAAEYLDIRIAVAEDVSGPQGSAVAMDNITALGRLAPEDLAQWLAAAAIFVAPARYEPFGLTILEAALSACALVLGDIPSLRELWDGAALFVDPDDEFALRTILRVLTDHPERAAKLGREARRRARKYSIERMAEAYHGVYRRLLEFSA